MPDDVTELAPSVLPHRLVLAGGAVGQRRSTEEVVAGLLARVPVPRADDRPGHRRPRAL